MSEKKEPNKVATQGLIDTVLRRHREKFDESEFLCMGPFLNIALVLRGVGVATIHIEGPVDDSWAGILPEVVLRAGQPEDRQVRVPAGQRVRVRVVAEQDAGVWLRMWNESVRTTG